MAVQKFLLKPIQKVRQYIRYSLALPDIEGTSKFSNGLSNDYQMPEPTSVDDLSELFTWGSAVDAELSSSHPYEHWSVSTVNPAAALLGLPGLHLRSGFRLVSYLYRFESKGVGVVWALPEELSTTAQLEKALPYSGSISQVPKPDGALPHFMDAIEGDRSPASFLIASILRRELEEFGALGDRCDWTHHRLIDTVPAEIEWKWTSEQLKSLSPKVKVLPDGQAAAEFFTCRTTPAPTLYRHTDYYPVGQYKPNSLDKVIARVRS
jgi:hypothetical protein